MQTLLAFYNRARAAGNFDDGIRSALERVLVSPDFPFRIEAEPVFVRGDCNASQIDHVPPTGKDAVDISDAAAGIAYLFQTDEFQFVPPCLDACDANDDGRVDLADSVFVLRYLFRFDRQPPEPFDRSPGTDPTPDRLGCAGGSACP